MDYVIGFHQKILVFIHLHVQASICKIVHYKNMHVIILEVIAILLIVIIYLFPIAPSFMIIILDPTNIVIGIIHMVIAMIKNHMN